jgi:DNA-binding beta-propeller fold protein YncE
MARRLGWSGWLGLLVGWVVLVGGRADAAPFEPGQIFIAYDRNTIGVFADTTSPDTGGLVGAINLQSLSSESTFTTDATLTGGGGVALDEAGNLYVTVQNFERTGNRGLIKIDRNGNIAWKRGGGTIDYRGVAASATLNRVFVATAQGIDVYRADDGQRLAGESFGGTFAFRDIAIDPQGNLYALRESPTGTVRVHFWAAGNFSGTGTELFSASGNTDPRALVVDEDRNLYITVNPAGGPFVRKFDRSGNLLATYKTPSGSGTLIGLDYDPGTQRLFASHTGTGIGQILWIDRNASSGSPMTAFGPTNLSGVRWLALYPTPEPSVALLVLAGGAALWWRRRQGGRESVHRKRE